MNLLRRLGLGRSLDGLGGLFGRRPSNGLWSVDPVQSSPEATAKDARRWVVLNRLICPMDDSGTAADAKTMAESNTTTGRKFRVALAPLAPPPSSSFFHYDWVNGEPNYGDEDYRGLNNPTMITAHGDSVLLEMGRNYFIYRAGASTRLPSLSRLPAPEISLYKQNTGILRSREGELLVVHLHPISHGPDLYVLHNDKTEWEIKKVVPVVADAEQLPWMGNTSVKAVAAGDRFMCWVQYYQGVLVCDVTEECPKLQYVPLPVVPPWWKDYYEEGSRPEIERSRDLFGTGDGNLRFVSIDLRCCCGGFGMTSCEHSRDSFMVTTWSMSLATEKPLAWVKDTVLHCEELWALPGYEGLPREHPECPIMSFDNPDVVYLRVNDCTTFERKAWIVEVNTRRKDLLSVIPCTTDAQRRKDLLSVIPCTTDAQRHFTDVLVAEL